MTFKQHKAPAAAQRFWSGRVRFRKEKKTMLRANNNFAIRTILAVFTTVLISGCAGMSEQPTKEVAGAVPVGGFLPQPSLLEKGKPGQPDLVYINPAANLTSYNKAILDPVTIQATPGSSLEKIPPEQRQALVNTLHTDLYNALSQRCQMVHTPAPNTMHFRIAMTDAKQANTAANTITTYIPQARLLDTVSGDIFNQSIGNFVGSVSAEGYATDATKGTLIWEGVDRRAGSKALGTDTLDSWADVRNASKAWAEQFSRRMAEQGICSQRT